MKVNKYIIGMFVATATLFVSCNTDNEGDIYNGTTMGVTFATGTQSVSFPSTGYEGFDVEVLRAKSSEATTINLSATLVVGDKEQELPVLVTHRTLPGFHNQYGSIRKAVLRAFFHYMT